MRESGRNLGGGRRNGSVEHVDVEEERVGWAKRKRRGFRRKVSPASQSSLILLACVR